MLGWDDVVMGEEHLRRRSYVRWISLPFVTVAIMTALFLVVTGLGATGEWASFNRALGIVLGLGSLLVAFPNIIVSFLLGKGSPREGRVSVAMVLGAILGCVYCGIWWWANSSGNTAGVLTTGSLPHPTFLATTSVALFVFLVPAVGVAMWRCVRAFRVGTGVSLVYVASLTLVLVLSLARGVSVGAWRTGADVVGSTDEAAMAERGLHRVDAEEFVDELVSRGLVMDDSLHGSYLGGDTWESELWAIDDLCVTGDGYGKLGELRSSLVDVDGTLSSVYGMGASDVGPSPYLAYDLYDSIVSQNADGGITCGYRWRIYDVGGRVMAMVERRLGHDDFIVSNDELRFVVVEDEGLVTYRPEDDLFQFDGGVIGRDRTVGGTYTEPPGWYLMAVTADGSDERCYDVVRVERIDAGHLDAIALGLRG